LESRESAPSSLSSGGFFSVFLARLEEILDALSVNLKFKPHFPHRSLIIEKKQ
jgi:hypothetical protein